MAFKEEIFINNLNILYNDLELIPSDDPDLLRIEEIMKEIEELSKEEN